MEIQSCEKRVIERLKFSKPTFFLHVQMQGYNYFSLSLNYISSCMQELKSNMTGNIHHILNSHLSFNHFINNAPKAPPIRAEGVSFIFHHLRSWRKQINSCISSKAGPWASTVIRVSKSKEFNQKCCILKMQDWDVLALSVLCLTLTSDLLK